MRGDRRRGEPRGAASGPDPAAGGGPHRTEPRGERPTWRPEDVRAGRGGFLRAALIVLGIIAAAWILGHAFNLWMSAEREAPAPGATRGGGSGYVQPEPGTLTPGGPAAANPDPRNPMQADPKTIDQGQRSGGEVRTPPASR